MGITCRCLHFQNVLKESESVKHRVLHQHIVAIKYILPQEELISLQIIHKFVNMLNFDNLYKTGFMYDVHII